MPYLLYSPSGGDCVVMAERGCLPAGRQEAIETISQGIDNPEIATLPPVARNDKKGVVTQPHGGSGR